MPINPDMLLNKDLEEVEGYWSEERIILYNIAVGSSQDPMNKSDLKLRLVQVQKFYLLLQHAFIQWNQFFRL